MGMTVNKGPRISNEKRERYILAQMGLIVSRFCLQIYTSHWRRDSIEDSFIHHLMEAQNKEETVMTFKHTYTDWGLGFTLRPISENLYQTESATLAYRQLSATETTGVSVARELGWGAGGTG